MIDMMVMGPGSIVLVPLLNNLGEGLTKKTKVEMDKNQKRVCLRFQQKI